MLYGPADALAPVPRHFLWSWPPAFAGRWRAALAAPVPTRCASWPAVRAALACGCFVSEHGLGPPPGGRTPDRLHGLLVVSGAFLLSLAISLWAKRISEPEQGVPPAPPSTVGVVGWPGAVQPIASLPAARGLTRRDLLRGMVIEGVKSDGTLDVRSPGAGVRYAFQSLAGQGPQAPRVPGVVPRRNRCGRQNVELRARGLYADPDQLDAPCQPVPEDPLPEPRCQLKEIWEHALRKGASAQHLARIEYYRAAAGPAWRFEQPSASVRFSVYGDCRRELSRAEASGSVP